MCIRKSMNILRTIELYTLNSWSLEHMNYISIKLLFKKREKREALKIFKKEGKKRSNLSFIKKKKKKNSFQPPLGWKCWRRDGQEGDYCNNPGWMSSESHLSKGWERREKFGAALSGYTWPPPRKHSEGQATGLTPWAGCRDYRCGGLDSEESRGTSKTWPTSVPETSMSLCFKLCIKLWIRRNLSFRANGPLNRDCSLTYSAQMILQDLLVT